MKVTVEQPVVPTVVTIAMSGEEAKMLRSVLGSLSLTTVADLLSTSTKGSVAPKAFDVTDTLYHYLSKAF